MGLCLIDARHHRVEGIVGMVKEEAENVRNYRRPWMLEDDCSRQIKKNTNRAKWQMMECHF